MNIADRLQTLRKSRGISQEALADEIGVSRQAVSKWESEQSMPDLDKIILLSEYFEVTTDYILRGIESPPQAQGRKVDANLFVIVATVLNLIGVGMTCAVWYEKQIATALMIGVVFLALGCMVYGVGLLNAAPDTKSRARENFWKYNIWLLAFLPLSCLYNSLLWGVPAPYPRLLHPLYALPLFWIVYAAICMGALFLVRHKWKP